MNRAGPMRGLLPALLGAPGAVAGLSPAVAHAADGAAADDPNTVHEVYLSRDDALREAFGSDACVESACLTLSSSERKRIEERLGRSVGEQEIEVFRAHGRDGNPLGYALITEEIGKFQPITFIVAVSPESKVERVSVMVYRESHGGEVRRKRFLSQFAGKDLDDRLRVSRDILNVSGATLSAHAITRGVKKVLVTIDALLIAEGRRTGIAWQKVDLAAERTGALPVRRMRHAMGTLLAGTAYGEGSSPHQALEAAFGEVARLEALLSKFIPESDIGRVNARAGDGPVAVHPDTIACVSAAADFARRTNGAFDPTLSAGGHRALRIDAARGTIALAERGLALDLGAIGKGFALDRAARVLESHGVERALLDFGGQLLALAPPPGEPGWLVAVRDPLSADAACAWSCIHHASLATSAAYERGPHIVDPRSGVAVRTHSASVLHPSATAADAYATAFAVLGAEGRDVADRELAQGALLLITEEEGRPRTRLWGRGGALGFIARAEPS